MRSFFISTWRSSNVLVVAPAATARIRRAEKFKGAVLGVFSTGSVPHLWANRYLAVHGVSNSDFSTVGIGFGASAIVAMETGRVNAASMVGGDHFHLLRRHPDLRILIDASTEHC